MSFDDTYDLESWEGYYDLYENKNWVGLLKLCERDAKNDPSDLYAQQRYADALNRNRKYKEALEFITPLYRNYYDVGFGISEIVDALYGLGKTKDDYDWINRPVILTIDTDTVNFCIELIKNRKRAVSISDIYQELIMKTDYCKFNERELAEFLVRFTDKFNIQLDNDFVEYSKLKVKRK